VIERCMRCKGALGEIEPLNNGDYSDTGLCYDCFEFWMPGIHGIIDRCKTGVESRDESLKLLSMSESFVNGAESIARYMKSWNDTDSEFTWPPKQPPASSTG